MLRRGVFAKPTHRYLVIYVALFLRNKYSFEFSLGHRSVSRSPKHFLSVRSRTTSYAVVRSIILNNRTYALTADTAGEVVMWDIIRGIFLRRYRVEDEAAVQAPSYLGSTAVSCPK